MVAKSAVFRPPEFVGGPSSLGNMQGTARTKKTPNLSNSTTFFFFLDLPLECTSIYVTKKQEKHLAAEAAGKQKITEDEAFEEPIPREFCGWHFRFFG